MSLVEERETSKIRENGLAEQTASQSISRRIIATYPGEKVAFSVAINGPLSHRVGVNIRGLSPSIATVRVSPRSGTAPFTSEVTIYVSKNATPGLYAFYLIIYDHTETMLLGKEPLGLLVLTKGIPPAIMRYYSKLRRIYRDERLGAQGVIWYLLTRVYKDGATFTELKKAYELIRGRPVEKATIAVILKRMIKKGLIHKGDDGKYYPLVTNSEAAYSRIDTKRVRMILNDKNEKEVKSNKTSKPIVKTRKEPYIARLAFKRAQKIAIKHNSLAAAYFLVYSLIGARETGILLLWLNAMFVYCEQKTGFCHYFYSQLLHRYFQLLGLREGIMYKQRQEYLEAMKIASRYIKRYYGSHQTARRLHYKLKKEDYIYTEPDDEILNIEILYYRDGDLGIKIWDNRMDEIEYEENIVDKPVERKEIKPAYPFEHIHPYNERGYSYLPAGLY